MRIQKVIYLAFLILLELTVVPVLNGTVITCDTAVNLCVFAALGAGEILTRNITVINTDRICGRNRIVRKSVILGNLADEVCRCLPIGKLFSEKRMENSTRCIKGLKLILNIESGKYVLCISDRQM